MRVLLFRIAVFLLAVGGSQAQFLHAWLQGPGNSRSEDNPRVSSAKTTVVISSVRETPQSSIQSLRSITTTIRGPDGRSSSTESLLSISSALPSTDGSTSTRRISSSISSPRASSLPVQVSTIPSSSTGAPRALPASSNSTRSPPRLIISPSGPPSIASDRTSSTSRSQATSVVSRSSSSISTKTRKVESSETRTKTQKVDSSESRALEAASTSARTSATRIPEPDPSSTRQRPTRMMTAVWPSALPTSNVTRSRTCSCDKRADEGMYCGYCAQIPSCDKDTACTLNAYGCGDDGACTYFGILEFCSQPPKTMEGRMSCPFFPG